MTDGTKLIIQTDGGARSNPGPAAIGVTVTDENQTVVFELGHYLGIATNNEAEYEAILASLSWLDEFRQTHSIASVTWKLDSKLVVEQLNRNWKVKEDRLRMKATQAWEKLEKLPFPYAIVHVLRHLNKRADALVNQALDAQTPS